MKLKIEPEYFRDSSQTTLSFPPDCRFCSQPLDWGEIQSMSGPKVLPFNPGTVEPHVNTCPYQTKKHPKILYANPTAQQGLHIAPTKLDELLTTLDKTSGDMRKAMQAVTMLLTLLSQATEAQDRLSLTIRKLSAPAKLK